jgi:hypothetical protein
MQKPYSTTYSLPIIVPTNTIVRRNNRIYLPSTPFLKNIKIRAISFFAFLDVPTNNYDSSYNLTFTLIDKNKEQRLFNYPVNDLSDRPTLFSNFENTYIRKFDISGIITDASFVTWVNPLTISTTTDPFKLGYFNFYT